MECDVVVLGGGPAGLHGGDPRCAARRKVVCVEREPALGGTCLRVGCIPTKAWVQTAHALHAAREVNAKLGVVTAEPTLDFPTANAWKDGVVKQMTGGVASLFKANGVEWVQGNGPLHGPNTIAVEGGEDVTFRARSSPPARTRCGRRSRASTRRAASTRPGCSPRPRCRAGSSCSAAGSSAASSPPSSSASAPR